MTNTGDEEDVVSRLSGEKDVVAAIPCEFLDETAPKKESNSSSSVVCFGMLFMTTFRLQFVPPEQHFADALRAHFLSRHAQEIANFFAIPLGCISGVKKKNSLIEITTKDFRQLTFRFNVTEIVKIHTVLSTYVFPSKIDYLFAFYHRLPADFYHDSAKLPLTQDWDVYDQKREWHRQRVLENSAWRISEVNKSFAAIETYPELLLVPACVPDNMLSEAIPFRSSGRIPCVCWYNHENGATLSRSSQPKIGVSNNSNEADEILVAAIASSSLLRDVLHIIDCRPMTSAVANRAKGFGVESSVNYKNCVISFLGIPNIHSMRDSMNKLRTLCLSSTCDNMSWLGNVEDTKWLTYIRQLLKSGLHVANLLRVRGESVLLHCSDGWDRTSQVASLAQLFADPFYRTWQGFQVLIEKDWLSFGHPFQLRVSHGEKADAQESPIFVQFLECVWQLVHLFPRHFEFNEAFLVALLDALHSCRFGTFLLDCRKHREEAELSQRTVSVWTWLNGFRSELTQPEFVPNQVLDPPLEGLLKGVNLWSEVHLRWSNQPLLDLNEQLDFGALFPDNEKRLQCWKLPSNALRVLGRQLQARYREVELIRSLRNRIRELEEQLAKPAPAASTTPAPGTTDAKTPATTAPTTSAVAKEPEQPTLFGATQEKGK